MDILKQGTSPPLPRGYKCERSIHIKVEFPNGRSFEVDIPELEEWALVLITLMISVTAVIIIYGNQFLLELLKWQF